MMSKCLTGLLLQVPVDRVLDAVGRLDGFQPTEEDKAEEQRHQAQTTGQFLVDPDGIVRWVNIEGAKEGLAGVNRFPSDEELVAALRALER